MRFEKQSHNLLLINILAVPSIKNGLKIVSKCLYRNREAININICREKQTCLPKWGFYAKYTYCESSLAHLMIW